MTLSSRRGIALVAALALMTLLGFLIAGAFAASMSSERASRLGFTDARLTTSADYAVATILGNPSTYGLADLPLGVARSYDVTVPGAERVRATVSATRLPSAVLWLVADVSLDGVDQGHRRINLVARFPVPIVVPDAGIVSRRDVSIGDSVSFTTDSSSHPECITVMAGDVVVAPGARVTGNDSVRASVQDSAADSSSYMLTNRQLAALDSAPTVVHVRGDTTIGGGTFAGILIVDGSIIVTGPFEVTGLMVARETISITTGSLTITGAMMAYGASLTDTPAITAAHAVIRYSRCVILTALRRASNPRPVRERAWAELF